MDYYGRVGEIPWLHYLSFAYLHGEYQVCVTVLASKEQWESEEAAMRAIVTGIQLEGL